MHGEDIVCPWICIPCRTHLNVEGYTPPSCAYHWSYWCISNESSSLKFHSRLRLCNRNSIYIFIKWCLIENATASFESPSQTLQAKVSSYQNEKKKLLRDFFKVKNLRKHFPLLEKYQRLSLAIIHVLEWIRWTVTGKKTFTSRLFHVGAMVEKMAE